MRETVFQRGGTVELRGSDLYVRAPGDSYDPGAEPELVADLAKVLGDDERARRFVEQYGFPEGGTFAGKSVKVRDVRDRSSEVRDVIALYASLRLVDAGKPRGYDDLHEWARDHPNLANPASDRPALVTSAQHWIAQRFARTIPYAFAPTGVGAAVFTVAARPTTVLGHVYARIGEWIARGDPVVMCGNREHREPFLARDRRMRFCSAACRARERYLEIDQALEKQRRTKR